MGGYKKEDWERMSSRLEHLDQAVVALWSFAEYAVNVLLELSGRGPEQHHQHSVRLLELKGQGMVSGDYSTPLAQLARFRLRATYGGYSSSPSVHDSTANLTSCLIPLKALRAEVDAALDRRQKR